ncbi:LysE family translocator [Gulosibacter chungangensis]|uniref:LysE family translocator n=1 Tax=Gulosibacter chungangensis TaxID=979746 RepID=A0A7J5BA97_9MICO|nr:LysE family translocator [Gulosibacter chungangensis]KAB1642710.1 LysE family translocator [Gulosibacter chungangensis]
MDWPMVASFWGVSILLVLTPGMDWAYVISAGLGRRQGVLPAVLGVLSGHAIATLAVSAGLATLVAASPVTMTILTFAGSGYMIWLGIQILRQPANTNLETRAISANNSRLFVKGLVMNLLNPKLYLFFVALLPQFISTTASWPIGVQIVLLGGIHILTCAGAYFAVGYGASSILIGRPRAAKIVGILSGVVMVGLGLALIAEAAWPLFTSLGGTHG